MDASFDYVRRIVPATETLIFVPGQWWLAGAAIDLYFSQSLYYDSSAGGAGQAVTSYLSCVRASAGFARTVAGTLTSFGVNTLRITNSGLLVEDSRTNTAFPSQAFTTTWGIQSSCSIADNQTTAPDGTTTAAKFSVITDSGLTNYNLELVTSAASPTTHSIFAKAAEYGYVILTINNSDDSKQYGIAVNLTTGAIVDSGSGGSPTSTANSVEQYATNGWWRISVTMDGGGRFYVSAYDGVGAITWGPRPQFNPSSVPGGIYIWGAQVEAAAFPSSYIPTTTGTVTRAADQVQFIGNLDSVLVGNTKIASMVVDNIMNGATSDQTIVGVNNAVIGQNGAATNTCISGVDANLIAGIGNSLTVLTGAKFGLAYTNNSGSGSRSLVAGGGAVATDAHDVAGANPMGFHKTNYGYVRRFTAWNSRLADGTLTGFTYP